MTGAAGYGNGRALILASELAETLAAPDAADDDGTDRRWLRQSLSKGAAGIAILHAALAEYGDGGKDRTDTWLSHAASVEVSAGTRNGLWFGVTALAFAAAVSDSHRYRTTVAHLDTVIAEQVEKRLTQAVARIDAQDRPALAEFDLVRGLTGLGAYLLIRGTDRCLLRAVLAYLARLTEPVPADDEAGAAVPGWWTNDAPSVRSTIRGHGNFGMAHGISGPLALMALAMRSGVNAPGQEQAMGRILDWLDAWRQQAPTGPWWPEHITLAEAKAGRPSQAGPARPSWCYGTPGLARAQQLAALAIGDTQRQRDAEQALLHCVTDANQLQQLVDPYLCHGWAGVAATVHYAALDADCPDLKNAARDLAAVLADHAAQLRPEQPPGLIAGRAGVALTLLTIAAPSAGRWPACLLLN
jgi:hypothetical protein